MKRVLLALVVGSLAWASTGLAQHAEPEIPWFDMKQCAFCKNMASFEDRLTEIPCDTHKIDNGMMMVTYVPDDLKAAMKVANEKMAETVRQLESGKHLPMCGFCQRIGMFMGMGAKMSKYEGKNGEVTLFTSDDPEVIKKLHEFADQTIQETNAHLERLAK